MNYRHTRLFCKLTFLSISSSGLLTTLSVSEKKKGAVAVKKKETETVTVTVRKKDTVTERGTETQMGPIRRKITNLVLGKRFRNGSF